MDFGEDDLIMISALSQYSYCPRRCALIHIEQIWEENLFTAEGRVMHERVHEEGDELRGNIKIARGVPLRSLRLGLVGVADVVEFHCIDEDLWQPFPVEYKRGKSKPDNCDMVQLCAQAMCLEEMLNITIPEGALFYGRTRRRANIIFDETLRKETEEVTQEARELIKSGVTPPPIYAKRCESCSIIGECMPKTIGNQPSVKRYLKKIAETI